MTDTFSLTSMTSTSTNRDVTAILQKKDLSNVLRLGASLPANGQLDRNPLRETISAEGWAGKLEC
jgi:hypothetical protein